MLRAGAVAFTLLAGATAAALILAHYSGFDSWPDLLSGSKGTDAGSASIRSGPVPGGGGSFLDLGPGGLPFASGAATLPPPGLSPSGTGLLIEGGGLGGGGEGTGGDGGSGDGGNGGIGGNGGTPGGTPPGPGTGGPGAPVDPGTPQPPSGGEPPSDGPGTGGPGTTPGGGPGEELAPPTKPGDDGGGDGCNEGKGQSIAASGFEDSAKSGGSESHGDDFEGKGSHGDDFESGPEPKTFESQPQAHEPKLDHAESYEPTVAATDEAVTESEEVVAAAPEVAAHPEETLAPNPGPESIPAPQPTD